MFCPHFYCAEVTFCFALPEVTNLTLSNYIRSNKGYQLENRKAYPYQQNTTPSAAEESGDMFSNWSFNSFDNDDYGTGRYGWMSNNMDVYLPLAVAANQ